MGALTMPRLAGNGYFIAGLAGLLLLMMVLNSGSGSSAQTSAQNGAKVVFTAVVADDDPAEQVKTIVAVTTILTALGFEPRVFPAVSVVDTITLTMTSNNGGQANAEFLDGGFTGFDSKLKNWELPNDAPVKGDRYATGSSLAALLRMRGFAGPIFLVTTSPGSYLGAEGGDQFATDFYKWEFWAKPLKFLEVFRKIFFK